MYPGKHKALDSLDIQIIKEMLDDANVSNIYMSKKLDVPLSTIHRRRDIIEKTVLKRAYELDPAQFGYRIAELHISVTKGKSEAVASDIFQAYKNVRHISLRMNGSNITAQIYIRDSRQLQEMMESIKGLPFVEEVHFSETIRVIGKRDMELSEAVGAAFVFV